MARRPLGKKPFDMSARVPMQLGRESISSSTVAISELIKHGYDADADDVQGTPTFLINGEKYSNMNYSDFAEVLDEKLAESN
mgnify:CR=1 FL=1